MLTLTVGKVATQQINRALENFEVDPSPGKPICTATDASRNQKVKAKLLSIETIEIHSFLQRIRTEIKFSVRTVKQIIQKIWFHKTKTVLGI